MRGDIAIVGYGPVGATAAAHASRRRSGAPPADPAAQRRPDRDQAD
jgi:flavin-dependent dehydrogenase